MILALLLVLQTPVPLQDQIDRLHADCRMGNLKTIQKAVQRVIRFRVKTPTLHYHLELALPLVRDPEARDWIATELAKDVRVRLAWIAAVGAWRHVAAREQLHQLLVKQLKKKRRRDRRVVLECARALGSDAEAFELCIKKDEPLAAAHCLPKKLHAGAAGIFLHKDPAVIEAAAARASKEYALELDEVARSRSSRLRRAAAAALKRLGKSVPAPDRPEHDTVHIVVEVSDWMKFPVTFPTRMQVALREARKKLKSLKRDTRFNAFTFASHVNRWKKAPVPASPDNIEGALSFLDRHALPRAGANVHGSLAGGFHKGADEVFVYAFGVPTVGAYEHPAEILIKVHDWNRFRGVRFHTIALTFGKAVFGAPDRTPKRAAAFMKKLAEWTGGTFRNVTKPPGDVKRGR